MCCGEALARLVDVERHDQGRPRGGTRCPRRRGAGSTRRPIVASYGFVSACMISTASPRPSGRSMQIGVTSRNVDGDAVLVRERRLDHLLLHLAVQRDRELVRRLRRADVDQRVLLVELRQRDAKARAVAGIDGLDDRLERRRRELVRRRAGRRRRRSGRRSARREPPDLCDRACRRRRPRRRRSRVEHREPGHLPLAFAAEAHAIADAQRSREQPRVRDLLAALAALDLEDAGRERRRRRRPRSSAAAPRSPPAAARRPHR